MRRWLLAVVLAGCGGVQAPVDAGADLGAELGADAQEPDAGERDEGTGEDVPALDAGPDGATPRPDVAPQVDAQPDRPATPDVQDVAPQVDAQDAAPRADAGCGGEGQACCGTRCEGALACTGARCLPTTCGRVGQACCGGTLACGYGAACVARACVACGGARQPCCPAPIAACQFSLRCSAGVCGS